MLPQSISTPREVCHHLSRRETCRETKDRKNRRRQRGNHTRPGLCSPILSLTVNCLQTPDICFPAPQAFSRPLRASKALWYPWKKAHSGTASYLTHCLGPDTTKSLFREDLHLWLIHSPPLCKNPAGLSFLCQAHTGFCSKLPPWPPPHHCQGS